jgi:hypothetical protein
MLKAVKCWARERFPGWLAPRTDKNIPRNGNRGPYLGAGADQRVRNRFAADSQERESSESPMLKAFWRVAPSVLLSFLAICDALVFLRAIAFSSRTSPEVHPRRFFFRFAIKPPFRERQLVSRMSVKEKPGERCRRICTNDCERSARYFEICFAKDRA